MAHHRQGMLILTQICGCVFLLVLHVARMQTDTVIVHQPTTIATFLDETDFAKFTCGVLTNNQTVQNVYWTVNDTSTVYLPPGDASTTSNGEFDQRTNLNITVYELSIRKIQQYDNSIIKCVVLFEDQSELMTVMSNATILRLQGLLGIVENITFLESSKTVRWHPPVNALNLTDAEHIIEYCVSLTYSTNGSQIFPAPNIRCVTTNETEYTFNNITLSSCIPYNVTITPMNSIGVGNMSQVTIHWFIAPPNITNSSVHIAIANCSEHNQRIQAIIYPEMINGHLTEICSCEVAISDSKFTTLLNSTITNEVICNSSALILNANTSRIPLFEIYHAKVTLQNSAGTQSFEVVINTHFVQKTSVGLQTKNNTLQIFINFTEKLCGEYYTTVVLAGRLATPGSSTYFSSKDSKYSLAKYHQSEFSQNTSVWHTIHNLTNGSYILLMFDVSESGLDFYGNTPSAKIGVEITGKDIVQTILPSLQEKVRVIPENNGVTVFCEDVPGCTALVWLISQLEPVFVNAFNQPTTSSILARQTIKLESEGHYSVKVFINFGDDFSSIFDQIAYSKEIDVYFTDGNSSTTNNLKYIGFTSFLAMPIAGIVIFGIIFCAIKQYLSRKNRMKIGDSSISTSSSNSRPPTANNESYKGLNDTGQRQDIMMTPTALSPMQGKQLEEDSQT